jgi:hypothetical protein
MLFSQFFLESKTSRPLDRDKYLSVLNDRLDVTGEQKQVKFTIDETIHFRLRDLGYSGRLYAGAINILWLNTSLALASIGLTPP